MHAEANGRSTERLLRPGKPIKSLSLVMCRLNSRKATMCEFPIPPGRVLSAYKGLYAERADTADTCHGFVGVQHEKHHICQR